jgi:hypothetical protein
MRASVVFKSISVRASQSDSDASEPSAHIQRDVDPRDLLVVYLHNPFEEA